MVTSFRKGNSWWSWRRNGFLCEVQPRDSQATELHHVSQSSSLKEVGRNYDRKGLKSWDKTRVVTHQLLLRGKQTQCVDITIILLSITNRQQQTETESKLKSPFPPIHPLQPLLDTEEQGMEAVLSPELSIFYSFMATPCSMWIPPMDAIFPDWSLPLAAAPQAPPLHPAEVDCSRARQQEA